MFFIGNILENFETEKIPENNNSIVTIVPRITTATKPAQKMAAPKTVIVNQIKLST